MNQKAKENKYFWWRRSILSDPYRIWAFCVPEWETPVEVPHLDLQNTWFLKTFSARRFKNQRKIELSDIQPSKTQCFSRLAAPGLTCSAPLTKAGRQTIYSNSRYTAIGRLYSYWALGSLLVPSFPKWCSHWLGSHGLGLVPGNSQS